MSREDADVAEEMQSILAGEGIDILLGAEPVDVQGQSGKAVSVAIKTSSGVQRIEGSDLLVAIGRVPNPLALDSTDRCRSSGPWLHTRGRKA